MQHFKDANPDSARIQCFVIDKDFSEISVLKSSSLGSHSSVCVACDEIPIAADS
jgi:hypothetical protein